MPSKAGSGSEHLTSGATGHATEHRKASKQYQTLRFAKEKPLSLRSGPSLKFKEKVKAENPIRPPHADLPLKSVKNDSSGFVVQTEYVENEQQCKLRNCPSEEELVKYMSKVPGYLLRGEKPQDNVLNFGVLDWGRLEKWTHKQSKVSGNDIIRGDCSTATNASFVSSVINNTELLTHQGGQYSRSVLTSFHVVDTSPVVEPLNGKEINHPQLATSFCSFSNEKQENRRKAKPRHRHSLDVKSSKGKAKQSDQGSCFLKETTSSDQSNLDYKISGNSKDKISIPRGEPENCAEKFKGLRLGKSVRHCSGKQENIVILLPKDFSRPESSEIPRRASLDGKPAEFSWGSFSDIFSVDQIQSDELLSDVQHSYPLRHMFETERELDLKLDSLVKAQGFELPVNPSVTQLHTNKNNVEEKTGASTTNNASCDLNQRDHLSFSERAVDTSVPRRFSFSEIKLGRSLSYKEGSAHSQLKSTYVSAKSGPAKPESSAGCEAPITNTTSVRSRARNGPFRRLLDPLLKHRAVNKTKQHPSDLRLDPPTPMEVPSCEECEASTVKAFLHLTVSGGLPIFKFMVETKKEILASTVKNLSTFEEDDSRWLYTFYSVHKNRKKSAGWKNDKVKPPGYSYNIIGEMKVSNPRIPSWCEKKTDEQYLVKESVLYSGDLGKENAMTSEFMSSRELAAVVVKMPKGNANGLSECFSDAKFSSSGEDEMSGHTVVILPGGIHSLPHEGVPSPLINRWRSGGLCDCGGWDVECKLKILTNPIHERKTLISFGLPPMQVRCDLFEQGESKETEPFFSLIPFQDGLFSVEFDAKMSALQAFSICVAIINSQVSVGSLEWNSDTVKASTVRGEGPEKLAPHPPLSPVGRV